MQRIILLFVVASGGAALNALTDAEKEALKPIIKYAFTTSEEPFDANRLKLPAEIDQKIINEAIPFSEVIGVPGATTLQ